MNRFPIKDISIPAAILYVQRVEILDKQIDAMVYALYGLSAEEIAVVEKR